ncbi:MAG: xylose reductase [Magnetovibrio sp.]|nr:xylose reductase [Magnetovibrio sp.]
MKNSPDFIYGTAWKEDKTKSLVLLALRKGFLGIDTANQRKHYNESAVGEAISEFLSKTNGSRKRLFLQTKFTHIGGQDQRLPYEPDAPVSEQVQQSFVNSLKHLRRDFIDSYILHGPSIGVGLSEEDWKAWAAMESLFDNGKVKALGISNISLEQLRLLMKGARIRPKFVQNRCFASRKWDRDIRIFCQKNNLTYQGFSLLTANHKIVQSSFLKQIAQQYQRTPSQIIFRFAYQLGIIPLTGTSNATHMADDLEIRDFSLNEDDIRKIEENTIY